MIALFIIRIFNDINDISINIIRSFIDDVPCAFVVECLVVVVVEC